MPHIIRLNQSIIDRVFGEISPLIILVFKLIDLLGGETRRIRVVIRLKLVEAGGETVLSDFCHVIAAIFFRHELFTFKDLDILRRCRRSDENAIDTSPALTLLHRILLRLGIAVLGK